MTIVDQISRTFVDSLQKEFGANLHAIILHGSYATGEATKKSDIDLLIIVEEENSKWREKLILIYDEFFHGRRLPTNLDIITLDIITWN